MKSPSSTRLTVCLGITFVVGDTAQRVHPTPDRSHALPDIQIQPLRKVRVHDQIFRKLLLNGELVSVFKRWYSDLQLEEAPQAA